MLALRAARSMRGGGGARERGIEVFALVVGSGGAIDGGRIDVVVVGGSRSIIYRPLGIVALVLTVLSSSVSREGGRENASLCFLPGFELRWGSICGIVIGGSWSLSLRPLSFATGFCL